MTEQNKYEWGELRFPVQKREATKAIYESPETVLGWIEDCAKKADSKGIKRLFVTELDWKDICKDKSFWEKFEKIYEELFKQRDENLNDQHFVTEADQVLAQMDEHRKHFFEWPKRLDIN